MTGFDYRDLDAAVRPIKTVDDFTWRQWESLSQQLLKAETFAPLIFGLQHISNIVSNDPLSQTLPGEFEISELRSEWRGISKEMKTSSPLAIMVYLHSFLFDSKRFVGVDDDFDNPEHSCIDKVIHNKTGLPILLSAIYMDLAKDAGLETRGCALPCRFLVIVQDGRSSVLIDPSNRGRLLSVDDAQKLVEDTGNETKLTERDFAPPKLRHILTRACLNLMACYSEKEDADKITKLLCFQTALWPERAELFEKLGKTLFMEHREAEAIDAFRRYLYLKKRELPEGHSLPLEVIRVQNIINKLNQKSPGT